MSGPSLDRAEQDIRGLSEVDVQPMEGLANTTAVQRYNAPPIDRSAKVQKKLPAIWKLDALTVWPVIAFHPPLITSYPNDLIPRPGG